MALGLKEKVMKNIVIATIVYKLADHPEIARVFKACWYFPCWYTFLFSKVNLLGLGKRLKIITMKPNHTDVNKQLKKFISTYEKSSKNI